MQSVLEQAIQQFQSGNITQQEVINAYYQDSRVKRVIADACARTKLSGYGYQEDLKQELAILMITKFLENIKDPNKVYNVLHLSACNISRRRAIKIKEDSLDAILEPNSGLLDNGASALIADSHDFTDEVEARFDQERAINEFNRRVAARGGTVKTKNHKDHHFFINPDAVDVVCAKPVRQKNPGRTKEPSPEGIELNEIRKKLGLSIEKFAVLLNQSKGTLSSYLYGIVEKVPQKVMEEARTLSSTVQPEFAKLQKKFDKPMEEILDAWINLLGLTETGENGDKSVDTQLAEFLSVDRATVWRWRTGKMKPDIRTLDQYDNRLKELSRNMA